MDFAAIFHKRWHKKCIKLLNRSLIFCLAFVCEAIEMKSFILNIFIQILCDTKKPRILIQEKEDKYWIKIFSSFLFSNKDKKVALIFYRQLVLKQVFWNPFDLLLEKKRRSTDFFWLSSDKWVNSFRSTYKRYQEKTFFYFLRHPRHTRTHLQKNRTHFTRFFPLKDRKFLLIGKGERNWGLPLFLRRWFCSRLTLAVVSFCQELIGCVKTTNCQNNGQGHERMSSPKIL